MTNTPWIVIFYGGSYGLAHESEELGCLEVVCIGMTAENALRMSQQLNRSRNGALSPHHD